MIDNKTILEKLLAREGYSFHADRQLSDEILLQAGWRTEAAPDWSGGFAWTLYTPQGNKVVTVAETHRPHPLLDLDDAYHTVPQGVNWACGWSSETESYVATVGLPLAISHDEAPMALLIALFNFKLGGEALAELGYLSENTTGESYG